jgi:hypothetical protein
MENANHFFVLIESLHNHGDGKSMYLQSHCCISVFNLEREAIREALEDDKEDKADSEYLAIYVKVLRYSSKTYDFKSSQVLGPGG